MYIYSLMLFVVDSLNYFKTNCSVHKIGTRYKNHLHVPSVRLAAMQRGTTYSAIKILNKLPPRISGLKNDETIFESALGKYLLTCFPFHRRTFITRTALVYFCKRFLPIDKLVVLLYRLFFLSSTCKRQTLLYFIIFTTYILYILLANMFLTKLYWATCST